MSGKVTHGADVEQLDDIAVGLRRQSGRIADVGGRGAAHLEKLRALWDGPDFEKFAQGWREAHRAIDDAEAALRTFSRTLAEESEQQRQKSRTSSGGGSGQGHAVGGGTTQRAWMTSEQGQTLEGEVKTPAEKQGYQLPTGTVALPPLVGGGGEWIGQGTFSYEPSDAQGSGLAFERVDNVEADAAPAFERVEDGGIGAAFERVDSAAAVDVSPGVVAAPQEPAPATEPALTQGSAPQGSAPQIQASDAIAEHSVAVGPTLTSELPWADASPLGDWLGLEEMDLTPWSK